MNTTLKVTKYQLYYSYKGVIIFYAIIFLIALALAILGVNSSGRVTFGGLGTATMIYLFIAGLDWFKPSFKFMMANSVSRKNFYYGSIIAFVILAAFAALVDTVISGILGSSISYKSVLMQIYGTDFLLTEFLWSFALYTFLLSLGWLITIIYYRANGVMKIIVFVIPFLMIMLFGYIERQTGGVMGRAILDFLNRAMGFAYNNNANIGALSFLAAAVAILFFCFLFVRKAPIKD